jgi:Na+/phosphate symporter
MEDFQGWFRFIRAAETKLGESDGPAQEIRKGPCVDSVSIAEDLTIMIGHIEDMTRLLPACIVNCRSSQMDECESLAEEVRRQAKILTRKLVCTHSTNGLPKGLIRFPLRLERIADELDSILTCCRIKARDAIEFSDAAHGELHQVLAILLEMLENLRHVMATANREVLTHIMSQGEEVTLNLRNARFVHWIRLESGHCTPEAGSLFLDMLDSLKSSNEYVHKMASTFSSAFNAEEESGASAPETVFR